MKKQKLALGIALFIVGFIGVLSILSMDFSLPPEAEALTNKFSPEQIKLLILVNPTLLLLIATVVGTLLYSKMGFSVPLIENAIAKNKTRINLPDLIKNGIAGGIIAGVLLSLVGFIFYSIIPQDFLEIGEKLKPSLAARFLYGGFTEEILMRFGLMTFVVWGFSKILKGPNTVVYWIGIFAAAIIFALGHLPIVFQATSNPSAALLSYILIANSIGGVIFGWLYWKKGLESAFIAHIFTHIIMVLTEPILN